MRVLQIAAPLAGLFTFANALGRHNTTGYPGATTITVVTTNYETYCPVPTTFIHKNVTYTATEETTITITNCPCTVTTSVPPPTTEDTVTVYPPPTTIIQDCTPVPPKPSGEAPPPPPASPPPPPASPPPPPPSEVTPTPTGEEPVQVSPGAADKLAAGAGVGVAAIVGLAALLV